MRKKKVPLTYETRYRHKLIMLAIEAHQDRVLNEIAAHEKRED